MIVDQIDVATQQPAGLHINLDHVWEDRFSLLHLFSILNCSPNGLRELKEEVARHRRHERLVVITPSQALPVGRWTMEWSKISQAIELGRKDIEVAIDQATSTDEPVFVGTAELTLPAH